MDEYIRLRSLVLTGTGLLLMSCGGITTYPIPAAVTLTATAYRYAGEGVFVAGTTNLPDGTRLGIELKDDNGITVSFDSHMRMKSGRYLSAPFRTGKELLKPGKHVFRIFTYFNGLWQSNEVLDLIGDNGVKLKPSALIHSDDQGNRLLECQTMLVVPPFRNVSAPKIDLNASVEEAIGFVRMTVPVVGGHRTSAAVEESIEHYLQRSYFAPGYGWAASKISADTYRVTFDFVNGDDRKSRHDQALWDVNAVNGGIAFGNQSAKNFSYIPWAD